ncbi:MAG: 50S ribosomal protein L9 [Endomicrobium sp.]|jgi:large subunit ribosomal protein L9|nr:50S ribosomal protein L9 [Endomicrobium sp.]
MKVILMFDIANVGRQGDVKEISAGFARNYLVPRKLAMEATIKNLKAWAREKVRFEKKRREIIDIAKEIALKMEAFKFAVKVKIGENGKIFGSITAINLSRIFKEKGFEINKHDILLPENIKELGDYEINVRLHPEVAAKIKLSVTSE